MKGWTANSLDLTHPFSFHLTHVGQVWVEIQHSTLIGSWRLPYSSGVFLPRRGVDVTRKSELCRSLSDAKEWGSLFSQAYDSAMIFSIGYRVPSCLALMARCSWRGMCDGDCAKGKGLLARGLSRRLTGVILRNHHSTVWSCPMSCHTCLEARLPVW